MRQRLRCSFSLGAAITLDFDFLSISHVGKNLKRTRMRAGATYSPTFHHSISSSFLSKLLNYS